MRKMAPATTDWLMRPLGDGDQTTSDGGRAGEQRTCSLLKRACSGWWPWRTAAEALLSASRAAGGTGRAGGGRERGRAGLAKRPSGESSQPTRALETCSTTPRANIRPTILWLTPRPATPPRSDPVRFAARALALRPPDVGDLVLDQTAPSTHTGRVHRPHVSPPVLPAGPLQVRSPQGSPPLPPSLQHLPRVPHPPACRCQGRRHYPRPAPRSRHR